MTWPFGCRGCKSKDSEIAFLRGQFASARTIYKEPSRQATQNLSAVVSAAIAANADPPDPDLHEEQPERGSFFRDPVQDFDPTKDDR